MKHILFLLAMLVASVGLACTTFVLKTDNGEVIFGRNFDFPVGMGHIHINYRNVEKVAFLPPPCNPAKWVSKYGNVTFNQAGREFPYGGMNEAGLVVEQMWLQQTDYPQADERPEIGIMQWIQFQLDRACTVEEVVQSRHEIRISQKAHAPLHFLVCDASGDVATIEFLGGKMQVHRGENLPYPVLANCPYEESLQYKSSKEKQENKAFNGWTENSSGRFVEAEKWLEKYDQKSNPVEYAFTILKHVAQEKGTQWSIVYDATSREIYYQSTQNAVQQKIELKALDFACNSALLFIDMKEDYTNPESLRKLSFAENLKMVEEVVKGVDFLRDKITPEQNQAHANFGFSVGCGAAAIGHEKE